MSRRILVIDADVGFQRLLRDQLGPYGFDIVIANDGADAMARLPQVQPTLLVIAVEEPDKQGFATFNKAKKGAASGVPIVLATGTVSPDSFANHRRLKLHADEYIDKRSVSADELLGKIDNLIGLGEMIIPPTGLAAASDTALRLPIDDLAVEVDEVPMELSDGDLVMEETFGEDEAVLHEGAPPVEDLELAPIGVAPGQGSDADFQAEDHRPLPGGPIDEGLSAETDAAFDALLGDGGPPAGDGAAPPSRTLSAIPEPVAAPSPPHLPVLIEPEGSRAPSMAEDLVDVPQHPSETAIPRPIGDTQPPPMAAALAAQQASRQRFVDAPTSLSAQPPPGGVPDAEPPRPASILDLGLDEVAARADEEQSSGMHDRRTLQKIHTLEKENARLKAELERSRDGSGKAGAGKEFLNLRELISARDKEILELHEAAAEHERTLTDARERLRQLQHAKTAVEAKNTQLEQRLFDDNERAETAEGALRAAEARAAEAQARLADVEHAARTEIERMAAAVSRAEKARAEAEAAMMLERGGRDSAIEQEKARALAALRAELEDNHAAVLSMRDQELEEQVAALRRVHAEEQGKLEEQARNQVADVAARHARELAEAQRAHEAVQAQHGEELAAVQQSLADQLSAVQRELAHTRTALESAEQASAALQQDQMEALASAGDRHQREMAAARQSHADEMAGAELRRAQDVAAATAAAKQAAAKEIAAARQTAVRDLAAARDELATALAAAEQQRSEEVTAAQEVHRAEVEELTAAHARELAAERTAAAKAVADIEARLGAELATMRAAAEEADAQLRAERRALAETRRDLEAQHAAALADGAAQLEAAVAAAQRAHADELEQHRAAHGRELTDHQARHAAAMDELRAQHVRGLAEKDAAHAAAVEDHRRSLQQAAAGHAEQLNQIRAEHARALDQAEIRLRTQREADRADADRALAATRADHEVRLAEAHDEIAQLEKGLSGAREHAQKLEQQIAALEQTIKLRDGEIRSQAAAIGERDRRLTELRGEIESLEGENASYQEQVLKAYQKIKADEATVARAKKALAIALTALHEEKKDE